MNIHTPTCSRLSPVILLTSSLQARVFELPLVIPLSKYVMKICFWCELKFVPRFLVWVVVVVVVVVVVKVVHCLISCDEILDELLGMPEIFEVGDDDGWLWSECGEARSAYRSSCGYELRESYIGILGVAALRSRGMFTALLGVRAALRMLSISRRPLHSAAPLPPLSETALVRGGRGGRGGSMSTICLPLELVK